MSSPFDRERESEVDENFEGHDLTVAPFEDQEQVISADIEPTDDTEDDDESEPAGSDIALGSVQQYLRDIGSVALLTREREVELGRASCRERV